MDKELIICKVKELANKEIKGYKYCGWFDKDNKFVHFASEEDAKKEICPLLDLISDEDLKPRPYEYSECIEQNTSVKLPEADFVFDTEIHYNSDGPYAEIYVKFVAPEDESIVANRIWYNIITADRNNYDKKDYQYKI